MPGMASAQARNYVTIAKDYAKRASSAKNKDQFCKWIRLAAARFLNDLKRARAKHSTFVFDEWAACDPCDFIEKLPHVEGKWDTPTIVLHESDIFFIVQLFGFRKLDGNRRFTTALKAIARKNAKSTIAAAIALYCQVCEGEQGPQVVSAATTGSQARIVFNTAKRMVEKTLPLREAFTLEAYANSIASFGNGGFFKPINSKASTQDGLNPSCVVLDEIHAHKDPDLLNVLRSAAGARANPLFLFTTTEGYESPGPWGELRQFAKQVLEGAIEADHFLAVYYTLDEEDKDFDERKWQKANPLMAVNPIILQELRKEAVEAKAMPGRLAEFRIKRLNRQSSTARGWIKYDKWKRCAVPFDLEDFREIPCWGGLDLASTGDLCSFRLVWKLDGVYYTWGRRWVPSEAVEERKIRGTVPYHIWIASGFMEQTLGEAIDFDIVGEAVIDAHKQFNLQFVHYDPWKSKHLVKTLEENEIQMVPFIQGPKSYHPVMMEFERAYVSQQLRYGIDPVLTWCAANIVTRTDQNLNMAPDKKKSADKIDDLVALLMAMGGAMAEPEDDYISGRLIAL